MSLRTLELLAPAGNADLGITAINHGADAVYIGAPKFGARSAAGNSIEEIGRLIKHAHLFGAKVYATVNTIIYENEIDEVKSLINNLYTIGIDAIIIQDFGLLAIDLPPVKIIASTQTHNFELSKIKFLESMGFSRVILARELSLNEITTIASQTNIELEAFIHGALCVSFSGRCYMSQAICNRSANRGECAQPCRPVYDLFDENGREILHHKNILSLKDLNLSGELEKLALAGVGSFKIEGRLKEESYIKNIVSLYSQELDLLIDKYKDKFIRSSLGKVGYFFKPDANLSFNRGFTKYFFDGRSKKNCTMDSSGSLGKELGLVSYRASQGIIIESVEKLVPGDGLVWTDKQGKVNGAKIYHIKNNIIRLLNIENYPDKGTRIYRNYSLEFDKTIRSKTADREISLNISGDISGQGITLFAKDEEGYCYNYTEKALLSDKARTDTVNTIITQFKKSGNLPFKIETVEISNPENVFVPIATLNQWRRNLLQQVFRQRIDNNWPADFKRFQTPSMELPFEKARFDENIANSKSAGFYESINIKVTENALELNGMTKDKPLMTMRYCLRYELDRCPKQLGIDEKAKPWVMKNGGRVHKLVFNCRQCFMSIYEDK